MIIGINGKIGSGKDTIGSIIQYLTSECGNPNSSKHRSYQEFLNKGGGYAPRNFDHHYVSDWEVKKFAGKLKTIASLLTGVPIEKFEDQEFKQKYMSEEWNNPNPVIYENGNKAWMPMTYREFLQKLGTEAMRDNLHENVWVNALFADYRIIPAKFEDLKEGEDILTKEWEYPKWIITDMRFPNEMDAVYKREGCTIRVVRDYALRGGPEDPKNIHPSETALDNSHFDYEIINDGTIEDLIEKVREILIKEDVL
jgi:hypothetical protein